ncbi:MAG: hypothetical protein IPK93_01125 [Solirubrobacterales bacterium]|nr:hypothetical protein [Solirubrobacterales bacterium]
MATYKTLGVRRINVDVSLARTSLGIVHQAAQQMIDVNFDFTSQAIGHLEQPPLWFGLMLRCEKRQPLGFRLPGAIDRDHFSGLRPPDRFRSYGGAGGDLGN